jgi:hypothetical protein
MYLLCLCCRACISRELAEEREARDARKRLDEEIELEAKTIATAELRAALKQASAAAREQREESARQRRAKVLLATALI